MSKVESLYGTYDAFLRTAVQRCWERKGSSKVTFMALMLATRHAWSVAFDKTVNPESGKKMLTGAAGAAAVAVLVRAFLGGPIGLILSGASVASLLAVYGKNHRLVWHKVGRYRELVKSYEAKYDAIAEQHRAGTLGDEPRDLMMDGLMSRFLDELDAVPEPEAKEDPVAKAKAETEGFAAHVRRESTRDDEE